MIRNEIKNLNRNKNKKKILITLGGASNSKNLGIIYQLLKKIDKDLKNKINLIFTLNLNDFKNFKKLSRNFVNIKSELLVDSLKVWKFFPQVDFSINSAGVTSLELAYLGIPQIIFVTGDNQINNAKALSKLGLGYFLGNIKKISKGNFKKIFFKLLKNQDLKKKIYLKSKNLIDGKGSKRIAHFIEKYYFNKKNYVDHTFD